VQGREEGNWERQEDFQGQFAFKNSVENNGNPKISGVALITEGKCQGYDPGTIVSVFGNQYYA